MVISCGLTFFPRSFDPPSPYTKLVLMEDINALRNGTTEDVRKTTTRFCNLHHVRLVMAAAGFITALVSLAEM